MCVPELETRRCCKVGFSSRQANRVGDTHAKGSGGPVQFFFSRRVYTV